MKNPRSDQSSSFVSLCTFVSILDYTFNFVLLVPTGVENNAYAKFWREVQEYYCIFDRATRVSQWGVRLVPSHFLCFFGVR